MDIMEPGYKMLGSTGTQYLNPDYIQPLSTTLDSKNSPLALLAQTCSSIGKDSSSPSSSSTKLPVPSLSDKKDPRDVSAKESSSAKHRSTSESPVAVSSGSGRNGEASRSTKCIGDKSSKDGASSRSSSSSDGGGGGGGGEQSPKARLHPSSSSSRPLSSLVSLGNGSGKCTPGSANIGSLHRDYAALRGGVIVSSSSSSSSSGLLGVSLPTASAINNNKIFGGDMSAPFDGYPDEMLKSSAGLLLQQQQQQSLHEALRLQHEGIQSLQAAAVGLGHLTPSGYPPLLFGHPLAAALDPLMYSYSASLAAVHGLALNSHKLSTLSPYMSYARVSTSSDGSSAALVPVCKDPFCATGTMPPSLHSTPPHSHQAASSGGGTPSCGAGCTQCGGVIGGHDKSQHRCNGPPTITTTTSLASGGGLGSAAEVGPFLSSSLYPMSLPPGGGGGGGGGLVNPLLGMAAAAQLGVGLTPSYACSWLSGGEFCAKRFSKAEDLLQHLRTHASSADPILPAFPLPGLPLPVPPGFVGSGVGHPFNIPGSLSPSSLLQPPGGQAYPRSLSPNSLLNASRYHPYKPPFPTLSTGAGGGGGGFAGGMASALDAFYSSHDALFGHRIGAAAVGP